MKINQQHKNWVIPVGTHVVTTCKKSYKNTKGTYFKKKGSVGVILKAPEIHDGEYIVRFPDQHDVKYKKNELTLRKREIEEKLHEYQERETEFLKYKIYEVMVGSKAYNLHNEDSDEDIRGIYCPPTSYILSLFGVKEQLELKDITGEDIVFWEFEKFIRLALKANPNILEVLFSPYHIYTHSLVKELLDNKQIFVSQHIFKTYGGYSIAQFKKMEQDLRTKGEIRLKHASHCLRLLIAGIHALKTGEIMVDVGKHRDFLLDVKYGNMSFEDVQKLVNQYELEFNKAFDETLLPEYPDFKKANDILLHVREECMSYWDEELLYKKKIKRGE